MSLEPFYFERRWNQAVFNMIQVLECEDKMPPEKPFKKTYQGLTPELNTWSLLSANLPYQTYW